MSGKRSIFTLVAVLFVSPQLLAECSSIAVVQAPQSACKSGTATVAVIPVPGATYSWTVQGGTVVSGAGTTEITLALGTSTTTNVSVTATAGSCVAQGSASIALHDPFVVRTFIPQAHASEPLTITWSYENGSPATQTISGTDFGTLTLAPETRSYTYSPTTSGSKTIIIDAAMQTTLSVPTPLTRRRAVATTPASASACATTHTAVTYEVAECMQPIINVDAPTSVVTGTSFELSTGHVQGADVTWTIQNGTPSTATGDSVTVTAGPAGNLDVSVSVVRGACIAQLGRRITVTEKPVCNNPQALVSAGPIECGTATVNVSFTGTPPFQGTWSDNVPFTTTASTLTRRVTMPGNYSISSFEDGACTGTASGMAVLPVLGPTATITGKPDSCIGVDNITLKFTGTPPFSGEWFDHSSFTTNNMEIVKPVTFDGPNTLLSVYDGNECRAQIFGTVHGHPAPTVHVDKWCPTPDFSNTIRIDAVFMYNHYQVPLTVNWSDLTTVSDPDGRVYRFADPTQTTTFTINSAHDVYCDAVFDGPASITINAAPIPDFLLGFATVCAHATITTSLPTPPPAGTTVNWFLTGNGTILSGQGTNALQYTTGDPGGSIVIGCTFTFPDNRCATTTRQNATVVGQPVGTLLLSKSPIQAGETVLLTYTVDSGTLGWFLDDSLQDTITPIGICGAHQTCQAQYTSSHGPGTSIITLHLAGFCAGAANPVSVPLTIVSQ